MEAFGSKKSVRFDIEDGEELEAHLEGRVKVLSFARNMITLLVIQYKQK